MSPTRQRRRLTWIIGSAVGAVIVIVAAGGAVVAVQASTGSDRYRTAAVSSGAVSQVLTLTGTVQRLGDTSVGFATSGTVTSIPVAVGQTVTEGQTLATIDPAPLESALLAAQAQLANDQVTLESAQSGTTTSGASGGSGGTTASGSSSGSSGGSAAGGSSSGSTSALTAAITAMDAAVKAEGAACAALLAPAAPHPSSSPSPTDSPTATPAPTDSPSPSATPTDSPTPTPSPSASPSAPTPAEIQQCTTAIAKASAAISQAAATIVQASKSAGTSSTSSHGSTGSTTSTTSSTSQAAAQASRVASAAVAVLQDQSAVSTAQANLADATLVAPVGGVVASIPFSVGDTATTSEAVIISAAGDADITVDVPISDMSLVKSGLAAQVTPDGAQAALTGSVATVSLLPVSSTASTPSYPAVVTVANPPIALATGSQAVVALTVASATNALRVPTSALSGLAGNTATAIVLSGSDSTSSVSVQVGAVGDGWAQIVSGLQIGQQVVLADNQATLPSNSSTSTGRFGSGGGFGGGSFTGGTRTGGTTGGTTGGSSSRTGG